MKRRHILTLLVAAACAAPLDARADDPPAAPQAPASPYRFRVMLDLPILGLGGAATLAALVPPAIPPCFPDCSPPDSLPGVDARVLGNHSPAALGVANATIAALLVAPHAINLLATGGKDGAWLEDALLSFESVVLAQGATQLMKAATDRPAPLFYDASVPIEERTSHDALRSFWSGHTATAFAAATSFAVSYWLRHPRDPWRWVVLAGLESAALCTGLLKIRAGYHYPTDIAAGAAAGISIGVLVPMLHTTF
ncbi:MAG: phosphatase PAP2 family protein [Labilithrix sp.]|nr:phosphatase PAP2 family protein [Labilithrix sp.]